ncbi:hypothetical protein [Hymenobacter sp.]|uniref:hypothetical protein n=1 Tax=Hymenobacter sp. TaxID=1898978 RepID=UPI00286CE146|nr:hypothetical protein [Hymenobacter sp.]
MGTKDVNKRLGVAKSNRLYYDARKGSYSGKSIVNGKTYTLSQLRFKPGTF